MGIYLVKKIIFTISENYNNLLRTRNKPVDTIVQGKIFINLKIHNYALQTSRINSHKIVEANNSNFEVNYKYM